MSRRIPWISGLAVAALVLVTCVELVVLAGPLPPCAASSGALPESHAPRLEVATRSQSILEPSMNAPLDGVGDTGAGRFITASSMPRFPSRMNGPALKPAV